MSGCVDLEANGMGRGQCNDTMRVSGMYGKQVGHQLVFWATAASYRQKRGSVGQKWGSVGQKRGFVGQNGTDFGRKGWHAYMTNNSLGSICAALRCLMARMYCPRNHRMRPAHSWKDAISRPSCVSKQRHRNDENSMKMCG